MLHNKLKLYKNEPDTFRRVDEKLFAYNLACVPPLQQPDAEGKYYKAIEYLLKDGDDIVAGICAEVYTWNILYIALLFVDERKRHQGLGSYLLKLVEEEARALGSTLSHTDTYDFQGKEFYIKNGYEIFGTLDGCPPGHQRFYLKKELS